MKTEDLYGAALDWAVAKCEGVNAETFRLFYEPIESTDYDSHGYPEFHYSTVWSQAGPIIEREGISLEYENGDWTARIEGNPMRFFDYSPLVAAMLLYVASKMGDEVNVPKELIGPSVYEIDEEEPEELL